MAAISLSSGFDAIPECFVSKHLANPRFMPILPLFNSLDLSTLSPAAVQRSVIRKFLGETASRPTDHAEHIEAILRPNISQNRPDRLQSSVEHCRVGLASSSSIFISVFPPSMSAENCFSSTVQRWEGLVISSFMMKMSAAGEGSTSSGSNFKNSDGQGASDPDGNESGGNVFSRTWKAYLAQLEQKPVLTKSWTSAILFAASDLTAQAIAKDQNALDVRRALSMALWGLVYNGPVLHTWYLTLQRLVPATTPPATVAKVLLDQLTMGPLYLACFLSYSGVLNRDSVAEIAARIRRDMFPTLKVGWAFWIPAQGVNFGLVPPEFQVLYQSLLSYVWNIFLCSVAARGKAD